MSKRRHSAAFTDVELLKIKYNATDDVIKADMALVKLVSGVARGLPPGEVWDVSSFRSGIDNEPFRRDVVVAWLNAAYQTVYGTEFEHQSNKLVGSASGLIQVAAFAIAVDSTDPVSAACVAGITDIILEVKGIGQKQLQLYTSKTYLFSPLQALQLCEMISGVAEHYEDAVAANSAEKEQFCQNLATLTAQLLETAYKVQSGALIKAVHTFVANNFQFRESVLKRHMGAVFSKDVLESALGPNTQSSELWISSVLSGSSAGPLLSQAGTQGILQPFYPEGTEPKPIKFSARLSQDLIGFSAGSVVSAEFDLVKCILAIGPSKLGIQVQFGEQFYGQGV